MRIRFHLPDFYNFAYLHLALIDMIKENPEYFREGVEIASVYGCFPPSPWNGGRNINGCANEKVMEEILHEFNSRGVPCRFTLTNPLLEEKHMSDKFSNTMLKLADNGLNEAIVNTQVMEDYMRENFPKFKLTSSTCKQIRTMEGVIAELEKDYSLVVLDYNWNNKFDELEKIPEKYRSRIEVLINAYCFPDCKRRGEHYRYLGDQQIRRSTINAMGSMPGISVQYEQFECPALEKTFLETLEYSTHVPPENVFGKYAEMGFEHFKIEGRAMHPLNVIESIVYYMAKPEYKDLVRLKLGLMFFRQR